MSMHSIERYHDISMGHVVTGHESKCAHLHGHNYRITFVCAAEPKPEPRKLLGQQRDLTNPELDNIGRVIDFSVVKERLCMWLEENWDHKFLVWEMHPGVHALASIDKRGVVVTRFNPTAENMAEHLVSVVGPKQLAGTGVMLIACKVEETRKCSATFRIGGGA